MRQPDLPWSASSAVSECFDDGASDLSAASTAPLLKPDDFLNGAPPYGSFLEIANGSKLSKLPLDQPSYRFGRGSECDVQLEHGSISVVYAQLGFDSTGMCHVIDYGHSSPKGTFIDGQQLNAGGKAELKQGSSLSFGQSPLQFTLKQFKSSHSKEYSQPNPLHSFCGDLDQALDDAADNALNAFTGRDSVRRKLAASLDEVASDMHRCTSAYDPPQPRPVTFNQPSSWQRTLDIAYDKHKEGNSMNGSGSHSPMSPIQSKPAPVRVLHGRRDSGKDYDRVRHAESAKSVKVKEPRARVGFLETWFGWVSASDSEGSNSE